MIKGTESITEGFRLTEENAEFYLSPTGLLQLRVAEKGFEGRVHLSLAFPFETTERYVCVQDEEREEVGIIEDLSLFSEQTAELVSSEIRKKYFAPKIKRIRKLAERYGKTYWDCDTDHGPLSFTVKDTHRSLIRVGEDRIFVVDHDGCRYEIESIAGMDKKSHSKIELYL